MAYYFRMLFWVFSDDGSSLKKFLDETANMSADDRATHLEKNQVNLLKLLHVLMFISF